MDESEIEAERRMANHHEEVRRITNDLLANLPSASDYDKRLIASTVRATYFKLVLDKRIAL